MIRNQWYVILESNEVGNRPVGVTRLGEKMKDGLPVLYISHLTSHTKLNSRVRDARRKVRENSR